MRKYMILDNHNQIWCYNGEFSYWSGWQYIGNDLDKINKYSYIQGQALRTLMFFSGIKTSLKLYTFDIRSIRSSIRLLYKLACIITIISIILILVYSALMYNEWILIHSLESLLNHKI
jgi:hypothetical protein